MHLRCWVLGNYTCGNREKCTVPAAPTPEASAPQRFVATHVTTSAETQMQTEQDLNLPAVPVNLSKRR